MTWRFFLLCVAGLGAIGVTQLTSATAAPATFQAGEEAYIALHFSEARAAYRAAAALAVGPAKDRAAALRQLGVMTWRIDNRPAEAEHYFAEALAVGADVSATQAERARFFAAAKRFEDAVVAADGAVATASTPVDRKAAALAYARSVFAKLEEVGIAAQSNIDKQRLEHARDLVRPFSNAPPMALDLSEALLEVALRLDDGPLAFGAWMSYAREGADSGAWAPAGKQLKAALPNWRGGASATLRNQVFEGLRASQFFALSMLVASDTRLSDASAFASTPRVREVAAYVKFLNLVRAETYAYYRGVANGNGDAATWSHSLFEAGKALWRQLAFQGAAPLYSDDALIADLGARFGAFVNLGETGGVKDLHYGHVFIDDPRAIEQYGHRASIRRVALDRIVSNGYESWVWDGRQAHGGWADSERVVQIRPGYVDGALRVWDRMNDPSQRAEVEQKIALLSAGDDAIAARQPGAFLPGLAMRLEWQGENAIVARLKARGVSGVELKGAFLVEQSRIELDSSFYAHEGRHVLDKIALIAWWADSEELEFRAKLSEVAFSEEPRVCFGAILNPNIADLTSPHGRANKRVVRGLIAWMKAHQSQIAGLDPARPLMPQFDKLTSEQMRDAVRSMDPWAAKP